MEVGPRPWKHPTSTARCFHGDRNSDFHGNATSFHDVGDRGSSKPISVEAPNHQERQEDSRWGSSCCCYTRSYHDHLHLELLLKLTERFGGKLFFRESTLEAELQLYCSRTPCCENMQDNRKNTDIISRLKGIKTFDARNPADFPGLAEEVKSSRQHQTPGHVRGPGGIGMV